MASVIKAYYGGSFECCKFTSIGTKKNNLRKNRYFDGERKLKFPSSEDKASVFNNTYQWTCTLGSLTIALPFHLSCT